MHIGRYQDQRHECRQVQRHQSERGLPFAGHAQDYSSGELEFDIETLTPCLVAEKANFESYEILCFILSLYF